tara:strand:+ start:37 stop:210 length:174 start_codon:yes stop_codon:yes gene_type:complete
MNDIQHFVTSSIYQITIKGTDTHKFDKEIFKECAFAIMGGDKKEGMSYEEYKKWTHL